jgi:dolichol-phosphate hexosyltransferase
MTKRDSAIAVVIATLNEEEGIGPTIQEIKDTLSEPHLVVVDGKSIDRTLEIAKNMGASIILQEGKGKGDAMAQGLKNLDSHDRYVVFTDADYTYPAEFIPKMVEVLEHNPEVGMVIGNRIKPDGKGEAMKVPFYIGNKLIAWAHKAINGVNLKDPLSGLRVIRTDILKDWQPKSKGFDIEAEMNCVVGNMGFQILEIPIDYRIRLGKKKLGIRHGFAIMRRIISESYYF